MRQNKNYRVLTLPKMKMRGYFVSNSSSTSFLIATKTPLTEQTFLTKMQEYFAVLNGTAAYYKILSRAIEVLFDNKELILNDKHVAFVRDLDKSWKYLYRGESTVLNQDDWANIDNPIINTDIYIDDEDFFMRSDDSRY